MKQRILAALVACAVLAGCDTSGTAPPTAAPAPGGSTAVPATAAPGAPGSGAPYPNVTPSPESLATAAPYVPPVATP